MTAHPAIARGAYAPVYPVNGGYQVCPGCGGRHWLLGRAYAECASERCGYAMPLETMGMNYAVETVDGLR